tara:strand:- start:441 stop:1001 length:561 start_codon:yes stop_codon:yes gene_type:complete
MKILIRLSILLAIAAPLSGCSDVWCWPFECGGSTSSSGAVDDSAGFDLSKVTWLHTDVSNWPVTHDLKVNIGSGSICLEFGGTTTWPTAEIPHTSGAYNIKVNANPWVFVLRNGTWYGGTWEWMVPNGTCKPIRVVEGGHIKRPGLADWGGPVSGETYYFMVSSIARGANLNNYQARTNVVRVVWP